MNKHDCGWLSTLTHETMWEEIYNANTKEKAKQLAKSIALGADALFDEAQEMKTEEIKEVLNIKNSS